MFICQVVKTEKKTEREWVLSFYAFELIIACLSSFLYPVTTLNALMKQQYNFIFVIVSQLMDTSRRIMVQVSCMSNELKSNMAWPEIKVIKVKLWHEMRFLPHTVRKEFVVVVWENSPIRGFWRWFNLGAQVALEEQVPSLQRNRTVSAVHKAYSCFCNLTHHQEESCLLTLASWVGLNCCELVNTFQSSQSLIEAPGQNSAKIREVLLPVDGGPCISAQNEPCRRQGSWTPDICAQDHVSSLSPLPHNPSSVWRNILVASAHPAGMLVI